MENLNNKISVLTELTDKTEDGKMTFYHGTCTATDFDGDNVVIQDIKITPTTPESSKFRDLGKGFYLTSSKQQASNWARRRTRQEGNKGSKPLVKAYKLNLENIDESVSSRFLLDMKAKGRDRFKTEDWCNWILFYRKDVDDVNKEHEKPGYENFYADIVYGMVCDAGISQAINVYDEELYKPKFLLNAFKVDRSVDQLVIKNQKLLSRKEKPIIQYLGEVDDVMKENYNFDHYQKKFTKYSAQGDIIEFPNQHLCEFVVWITPIIAKNHNISDAEAMERFILSETYNLFIDPKNHLQDESWKNTLLMYEAEEQFGNPFRYGKVNQSDYPWENLELDTNVECFIGVLEEYAYERGMTGQQMMLKWNVTMLPDQGTNLPERTLSQDIMNLGWYCYQMGTKETFDRIDGYLQRFYKHN